MFQKIPIAEQIDEYAEWRYERHPLIATAHAALLTRFYRHFNIRNASDITTAQIADFAGIVGTEYYLESVLKTMRSFLHYCKLSGYQCIEYNTVKKDIIIKKGRPLEADRARAAIALRKKGMTYRKISAMLTEQFGKPTYVASIFRWING